MSDMLANIQRAIAAFLLTSILLGAWLGWHYQQSVWIWFAPVLVAVTYSGALALEFLLLRASYGASTDRPSAPQLLEAWMQELAVGPRTFLWRQPFRSKAYPDELGSAAQGRRGVVFVHGFVCNRGFWNTWLANYRKRGIPFVAVSLEPVFGSIDDYAEAIDSAVRRVESATGIAPLVVAHSMGGLAVRAWLARRAIASAVKPARVVTIGTPHGGTCMARHSGTRNGRQMRLNSEWLTTLERDERTAANVVPFTCFWGHCDNIVFPTRTATRPGADNRHLEGTPHIAMAFHPAVMAEVDRLLAM